MPDKLYDWNYLKELERILSKTFNRSIEIINPQPGDLIADIGCGIGNLSLALAGKGARVTGLDSDESFLKTARANNDKANPVNFILGDASKLDFQDSSFDKIVFHRVFQHLPEYKSVLLECNRTLKQTGMLHIVEPDYRSLSFFSDNIQFERKLVDSICTRRIPNSFKVRTLPKELAAAGFKLADFEVHNYILKPFALANYVLNFDDEIHKGVETGLFSERDVSTWNKLKELPDGLFNLSINMVLITAKKM